MPQHLRERKMCCCVALCLARATQKLGEEGKRGEATEVLPLQVPSAAASQFGKRDLPVAPGCVNTSPFSLSAGLPAACMTHTTIHGSPGLGPRHSPTQRLVPLLGHVAGITAVSSNVTSLGRCGRKQL